MLTLGEQLVLVALDADKGVLRRSPALQFGLNAAGLADLLDAERISLRRPDGSFGVTPLAEAVAAPPLDDRILDAVWEKVKAMPDGDRHPERCIQKWVEPSLRLYLDTLRGRGILDWDKPKKPKNLKGSKNSKVRARYGRFRLLDTAAADEALARVDRVRTGADPDARDRDLAGIVHGLALDAVLYSGIRARSKRAALASATEKQRFAVLLNRALPLAGQKFIFDSSRDLAMARAMARGVSFDAHHGGLDGGGHGGGGHGGGGHGGGGHH